MYCKIFISPLECLYILKELLKSLVVETASHNINENWSLIKPICQNISELQFLKFWLYSNQTQYTVFYLINVHVPLNVFLQQTPPF